MHSTGHLFVVCRVSGRHDGDLAKETMGIEREHPRYGYHFSVIVQELSPFAFHNQLSPFCPSPLETVRILTLDASPFILLMSTLRWAPLLLDSVSSHVEVGAPAGVVAKQGKITQSGARSDHRKAVWRYPLPISC